MGSAGRVPRGDVPHSMIEKGVAASLPSRTAPRRSSQRCPQTDLTERGDGPNREYAGTRPMRALRSDRGSLFSAASVNLGLGTHFAFLSGPLPLTHGGGLLPELLVAAFVVGAVIWQYHRRRGRR